MQHWPGRSSAHATELEVRLTASAGRLPGLEIPIEPIEDHAVETLRLVDELLEHRHPMPATDALRVHRDRQQTTGRVLPRVAQLAGPDLEDFRRCGQAIAAGARLEQ